jgi:hypothetical protein
MSRILKSYDDPNAFSMSGESPDIINESGLMRALAGVGDDECTADRSGEIHSAFENIDGALGAEIDMGGHCQSRQTQLIQTIPEIDRFWLPEVIFTKLAHVAFDKCRFNKGDTGSGQTLESGIHVIAVINGSAYRYDRFHHHSIIE